MTSAGPFINAYYFQVPGTQFESERGREMAMNNMCLLHEEEKVNVAAKTAQRKSTANGGVAATCLLEAAAVRRHVTV